MFVVYCNYMTDPLNVISRLEPANASLDSPLDAELLQPGRECEMLTEPYSLCGKKGCMAA